MKLCDTEDEEEKQHVLRMQKKKIDKPFWPKFSSQIIIEIAEESDEINWNIIKSMIEQTRIFYSIQKFH